MKRAFVTGGGGFLGYPVIRRLRCDGWSVVALDRSGSVRRRLSTGELDDVEIVMGDLMQPERYRTSLGGVDVVLHMAALTGRGTDEDHQRVNASGTAVLLEECARARVERFLFTSSIAVTFTDTTRYPYARAKLHAEELVRASGLRYAIVRPTMILGPGSQILAALEKLALLPVIPVFGDGKTLVQPVFVDDVARVVTAIMDRPGSGAEVFEVGGPEVLTLEHVLRTIRQARRGDRGRVVHVPVGLLEIPLRVMESMGLGRLLPVTAAQLSSFRYDGRVGENPLDQELLGIGASGGFRNLRSMLEATAAA